MLKTYCSRSEGRLLIILVFLAFTASCSTSFAYNRLDWLIVWYTDDYVDLSREQKGFLKTKLQPVLDWHRQEELANYIDLLDRIEREIERPIDVETTESWISDARDALDRIELSLLKTLLDLGESLSDKQVNELLDSLNKKQEEYREKYSQRSDEEYASDNFKSLSKNLRRFIGPLNEKQKKQLRLTASSMQRFDLPWLEDREAWLRTLEQLLQRQPGWKEAILEAHSQREANRSSEYRNVVVHNIGRIAEGIAGILDNLDAKQAKRLQNRINNYRRKLLNLSQSRENSGNKKLEAKI